MTLMCRGREGQSLFKQCDLMGRRCWKVNKGGNYCTAALPDIYCDFKICEHMVTAGSME